MQTGGIISDIMSSARCEVAARIAMHVSAFAGVAGYSRGAVEHKLGHSEEVLLNIGKGWVQRQGKGGCAGFGALSSVRCKGCDWVWGSKASHNLCKVRYCRKQVLCEFPSVSPSTSSPEHCQIRRLARNYICTRQVEGVGHKGTCRDRGEVH